MNIQTTNRSPIKALPAPQEPSSNKETAADATVADSVSITSSNEGPSTAHKLLAGAALVGTTAGVAGLAFGATGWGGGVSGALVGLVAGGAAGGAAVKAMVPGGSGAEVALGRAMLIAGGAVVAGAAGLAGGAWAGASLGNPIAGIAAGVTVAALTGYAVSR